MLGTEFALAAVGIGVAAFWVVNPWLIPFTAAPLYLIHRSLHMPQLEEQARIDSKTGLFNARHFGAVLAEELARAQRFERPLALIMADLDLLREINNTYGHLVGDDVLAGVAEVFRAELRHYDIPARFGGEEFAILLPETDAESALEIAERIRRRVAAKVFDVPSASDPVRVTISMGVACFPEDGDNANELLHHADLAVYRAKLQGRNRVLEAGRDQALLALRPAASTRRGPARPAGAPAPDRRRARIAVAVDRRRTPPPAVRGPRLFTLSASVAALVAVVVVGRSGEQGSSGRSSEARPTSWA